MSTIHVTTRSPDQIAAAFDAVFASVEPVTAAKPLTQEDRLAPYKKVILKQRRRGLTWKQIAAGMRDPRIGEPVSESTLKRVFAGGATSSAALRAGAARPVGQPPLDRCVLDPLTNLPVPDGR